MGEIFNFAAGVAGDKESKQDLPRILDLVARLYRDALAIASGAPELILFTGAGGPAESPQSGRPRPATSRAGAGGHRRRPARADRQRQPGARRREIGARAGAAGAPRRVSAASDGSAHAAGRGGEAPPARPGHSVRRRRPRSADRRSGDHRPDRDVTRAMAASRSSARSPYHRFRGRRRHRSPECSAAPTTGTWPAPPPSSIG